MLTRLKASDILPVSLPEVKIHLRLDHEEEDAYLNSLIAAATGFAEDYLGRSLLNQTWRRIWQKDKTCLTLLSITEGDTCCVSLPCPPLQKIISVNRLQENGKKIPIRRHYLEMKHQIPHLIFADVPEPVEIDYETGYGDSPAAIPAIIRHALLITIADFYEQRSSGPVPVNKAVAEILNTYRVTKLS